MKPQVVQFAIWKQLLGVISIFLALGVSATLVGAPSVTLAWNPNADPGVSGYKIYYGEESRNYTQELDLGNATNATVSTLVQGHTYYFAVTAYNTSAVVSDFSNEVNYTVPAGNNSPTANNISLATAEDTPTNMVLSGGDPDGDPLTYVVTTQPAHGSLSGLPPNLTYTPQANYSGLDSFTFKVNDGTGDSLAATVSIGVTPVNDPPVATSATVTTGQNQAVNIVLGSSDSEGGALTDTVVKNPRHGALSGRSPNLVYTPQANYLGADSFTFIANDGALNSSLATVSITVSATSGQILAIASPTVTDIGLRLAWSSIAGKTYRVLYKDDLSSVTWAAAGDDLPASGSSMNWVDATTGTAVRRFYRVELVNP